MSDVYCAQAFKSTASQEKLELFKHYWEAFKRCQTLVTDKYCPSLPIGVEVGLAMEKEKSTLTYGAVFKAALDGFLMVVDGRNGKSTYVRDELANRILMDILSAINDVWIDDLHRAYGYPDIKEINNRNDIGLIITAFDASSYGQGLVGRFYYGRGEGDLLCRSSTIKLTCRYMHDVRKHSAEARYKSDKQQCVKDVKSIGFLNKVIQWVKK